MKASCRFLLTTMILMAALSPLKAQETLVRVNFPRVDVLDVLDFYRHLIGRPVLVDLELDRVITTVVAPQDLSQNDAIAFIRKTLLESYGIEIRDSGRGEVLATWSQNPKYPHRDPPKRKKISTPAEK